MLAHRVVSAAWEKDPRQRDAILAGGTNQCAPMWAGYQQHPRCPLKQNKTPTPPSVVPCHQIAPQLTQFLKPKTSEFSLMLFCSCSHFSLSPNPVTSIFKICLESYYSPSSPSAYTGLLPQRPSPNSYLYFYLPHTW